MCVVSASMVRCAREKTLHELVGMLVLRFGAVVGRYWEIQRACLRYLCLRAATWPMGYALLSELRAVCAECAKGTSAKVQPRP